MSWYKVERGWLDNAFFQKAAYSERDAWQWMIGEAAFQETRISVNGKPIVLNKGQLYASYRFMAEKFQWSVNRVVRFVERLREWEMVNTSTDTGQNLITICNYSKYQDRKTDTDTPSDTATDTPSDTPSDTATDTNKKNLIPSSPSSPEVEAAQVQPEKPKTKKGQRLEAYLAEHGIEQTAKAWGEWAMQQGMTVQQIDAEMEKFRDWWRAAPAAKGVKADWPATWRNWARKALSDIRDKERKDEIFRNKFRR